MKKNKTLFFLTAAACALFSMASCEDDTSMIGDSLTSSEATITVDSIQRNLHGKSIPAPALESRATYTLLGSIDLPEYGKLNCSYVTRFLPAETLNVPDSISAEQVDSVKMVLSIPKEYVTGDSLALQQVKAFSLTKQIPSDITATFNPEGYYNPSAPIGTKSFNLSGLNVKDSIFTRDSVINVNLRLPVEIGRDAFKAYHENPDIFIWPADFAKLWPGVLVEPTFGQGCIEAVTSTRVFAYFPKKVMAYENDEEGVPQVVYRTVADSVCLFSTAPEVLSSVNVSYEPSASLKSLINTRTVITTPCGYAAQITFPAREILKEYWDKPFDVGVINNLGFSIPAKRIANNYNIGVPPALLMVKAKDAQTFFSEGKLPDNEESFYSFYSSLNQEYRFDSMRKYIVNLKDKGENAITDEDEEFVLIPVMITAESTANSMVGSTETVVTSVLPYLLRPTMVELETEKATVVFTFSSEIIN